MTSQLITNNPNPSLVRADGTHWPFAVALSEDAMAAADTAGELIAHLIPGYADCDFTDQGHDQALVLRWQLAAAAAADRQARLAAAYYQDNPGALEQESEETLTALFGTDRMIPVDWVTTWDHPVPLVLITTDYQDYTDRPDLVPPSGNIVWIDPSDEVQFLHTLANAGAIMLYLFDNDAEPLAS